MDVGQEADTENEDNNSTFSNISATSSKTSRPLATWYDTVHEHFVALLNIPLTAAVAEDEKILTLQTLTIPRWNPNATTANTSYVDSSKNKDYGGEELIVSTPLTVSLRHKSPPQEDAALLPLLVKFSLDKNLLAIQLSNTEVRVVQIYQQEKPLKKSFFQNHSKQWTIDLSISSKAYSSSSTAAAEKNRRPWTSIGGAGGSNYNSDSNATSSSSNNAASESILTIIWSDHGGNSQDLIILTTTAVRFYKVSIKRNQLAKTRKYAYLSDCYWYEPTLRVLLVGQSITTEGEESTMANKGEKILEEGRSSLESSILFWNPFVESTATSSTTESVVITKRTGVICQTFFLHHCSPPPPSPPTASVKNDPASTFLSSPRRYSNDTSTVTLLRSSPPYKFQLELPPPIQLPPFVLWNTAVAFANSTATLQQKPPQDGPTTATFTMSLANLYGDAYCVQVGIQFVKLFHLDKIQKTITLVRQYQCSSMKYDSSYFDGEKQQHPTAVISTVDNILCIHDSYKETTCFYDIAAEEDLLFCIGNSTAFQPCKSVQNSPHFSNIYNEGFSFIFPHFLLHRDGNLFRLKLNLSVLIEMNNDLSSILTFLLRRRTDNAHRLVLQYLFKYIQTLTAQGQSEKDTATTRSCIDMWMRIIALAYADAPETISVWDYESSLPLIHRTLFFFEENFCYSSHVEKSHRGILFPTERQPPPPSYSFAITQTEVLEGVFFPVANEIILAARSVSSLDHVENYCEHLQHVADASLLFVEALSAHSIIPCPSLFCFILSLKFNMNDVEALDILLHSYLTSDAINITARQIKKHFGNNRNGYQVVRQGTGELAETMMSLATMRITSKVTSTGIFSREEKYEDDLQPSNRRHYQCQNILITHALDLMCSVALYTTAAKHLLRLGRFMDAIYFCLMELETPYPFQVARQSASSIPGIRAVDFFVACKDEASRLKDETGRIDLFYHLYTFLMRWDRDSLLAPPFMQDTVSINSTSTSHSQHHLSSESSENKSSSNINQGRSVLAEDHPEFPDHLFGQDGDPAVCSKIRRLFGYPDI
jgi:hypothetical protein